MSFLALAVLAAQISASDTITNRLDSAFATLGSSTDPGCALAVSQSGRTLYARGFGLASLDGGTTIDTSTVFQAGSIAKSVTALAVMLLVEDRRVSLDDRIRAHLTKLPQSMRDVTVRQLLQHTSGIRDYEELMILSGWRPDDIIKREDVEKMISRQRRLNFEPGSRYLYSNTGYVILGQLVEKLSDTTLAAFVERRIFAPLQMRSSHVVDDHSLVLTNNAEGYLPRYEGGWGMVRNGSDVVGASNFYTTAPDLIRFANNLLNGPVGSWETRRLMQSSARLINGDSAEYGLGLTLGMQGSRRMFGHGGAVRGFLSEFDVVPASNVTAVALCNRWNVNPARLVRTMINIVSPSAVTSRQSVAVNDAPLPKFATSASALKARVGLYEGLAGQGIREIAMRDGKLIWARGDYELQPVARDSFAFTGQGSNRVVFIDRADGRTIARLIANGVVTGEFKLLPPFKAPRGGLASLAGEYFSEELDALYRLRVDSNVVTITGPKGLELKARPAFGNALVIDGTGATLAFDNPGSRGPRELWLSTERAKNIYMRRVSDVSWLDDRSYRPSRHSRKF